MVEPYPQASPSPPILGKADSIHTHIKVEVIAPEGRELNLRNISPSILQIVCGFLTFIEIIKTV
jgi:hypothetical protein